MASVGIYSLFCVLGYMSNYLPKGFTDADEFNCWLPCQAVMAKGGDAAGGDKSGKRWIQGIASTGSRDLQGEVVDQNGIDFSYFLKSGYFNNDHKPGFENKVGQPTQCKLTKDGLFVKGYLFQENEVADNIWGMMKAVDGTNRRVGFSIQGKVKRRSGTDIKECWIQDIAITPAPVNHTTWCEMAKSLSAQKWDLSKGSEVEQFNPAQVGNAELIEEEQEIRDKQDTSVNKTLSVQGGHAVVPESMDDIIKDDRTSKSLTYDDAVEFIMKSQECSRDAAESIAKIAFSIFS